jgi:hypothetical protein
MISLKSKKDKKKMMKGGSITNPEEKKLIFDALFQLCDSIIEDTDFQQFGDFKDTNQISYNNYNYLYLIFKYFFGLLFTNIFTSDYNDDKNNIELFQKLSKYFNIYYNNIRRIVNPTIDDNYCKDLKIIFNVKNINNLQLNDMGEIGKTYTLYSYFKRAIYELFKEGGYRLTYNNDNYLNFRIQLQSDILCNDIINSCLFDKYYVQSLLVPLYNFILENYSFNDFLSFIKSLNNIDITADYKNLYEDYIKNRNSNDSIDKILTIFNKYFKNIFKSTLFKEKDLTLEDNLRKVLNKSISIGSQKLSPSDNDYLTKKAFEYQSKFLSSSDNFDLLLSGLEAFKYYNSLNDFDNSINIIKKILDYQFTNTTITDSKQFNQLNLLLALLYYYSANKTDTTIEDFNFKYINNLLLAVYYFNKYFTNMSSKQTDIDNQNIKDLIANATKDYNEFELNILTIYVELIKEVCNFVNNDIFVSEFDKRQLLQLLFIAYTFYKQIDSIFITLNNDIDVKLKPIIHPLKEKQTDGGAEYNKLFKLINKESKDDLLSSLTAEIKKFNTIELMRLFFFRNQTASSLDEIQNKIQDVSLQNYYKEYFEKDTTKFKTNIFSEILKFDKNDNEKLPYALDVLFSIYKYNVQIPSEPTDQPLDDKYKSHVLEVFKDKNKYKEQFEFFKTLLNVFYMNISVLYYNLFISNLPLFEDFKKEIKFNTIFDESKINKKEILDIVFKEENKADIISKFIYHLRTLFQENKEINSNNIQFLLILFNNLYTSNEDDLMNFLCAMYGKIFKITINNPLQSNRIVSGVPVPSTPPPP